MESFDCNSKNLNAERFAMILDAIPDLSDEQADALSRRIGKRKSKPYPQDEYMTVKQVCDYLKLCRSSVWRYEKIGILKPHKLCGRKLFARSNIVDALNRKGGIYE